VIGRTRGEIQLHHNSVILRLPHTDTQSDLPKPGSLECRRSLRRLIIRAVGKGRTGPASRTIAACCRDLMLGDARPDGRRRHVREPGSAAAGRIRPARPPARAKSPKSVRGGSIWQARFRARRRRLHQHPINSFSDFSRGVGPFTEECLKTGNGRHAWALVYLSIGADSGGQFARSSQ